jgi:hypothetical protein
MKILQETVSSQTLKIIPKSYPTLVDVVITNEQTDEITTIEDLTSTTNAGYLDIPYAYVLKEDQYYSFEVFDKTDIQTPDYLTSEDYIQIEFSPDTGKTIELKQINFSPSTTYPSPVLQVNKVSLAYSKNSDFSGFVLELEGVELDNDPDLITHILNTPVTILEGETLYVRFFPYDSTISAVGLFLLYRVVPSIAANPEFIGSINGGGDTTFLEWDLTGVSNNTFIGTDTDVNTYSIGTDLTEGPSGPGAWRNVPVGIRLQNDSIFKGRIFCTNQDEYSIQNGIYTQRSRDIKYTIYE